MQSKCFIECHIGLVYMYLCYSSLGSSGYFDSRPPTGKLTPLTDIYQLQEESDVRDTSHRPDVRRTHKENCLIKFIYICFNIAWPGFHY